jgi:4-diphosphocytidyl-2-C-methyl-D-erythritol kinase
MITFPNAKINLGLSIVEKRSDGYHNLETVFYPIPLEDALEVTISGSDNDNKTILHQSGITIYGNTEDNLVMKAYRLLESEGYKMKPVEINLHKNIPSGAGLGGGSADAAFMITLLNKVFSLGMNEDTMEMYAARLGADCAFFVRNRPTFAEGIGEIFSPVNLSLAGYKLAVVKPDIFVSTREAFSLVSPQRPELSPHDIVTRPIDEWRNLLVNDFEKSVFALHPEIAAIKNRLYDFGALYAAMSGSGSSVFALFAPDIEISLPEFPDSCFIHTCTLK